jgi:hypothetical protein
MDLALISLNNLRGTVMRILTSKKAIITALSLCSIVLAGTIKDINSRTVRKSQAARELELAPADRGLASNEVSLDQKVAVMSLEVNDYNRKEINTKWEITRIIKNDETVAFDKINNPEDAGKMIIVDLELIRRSTVIIDNDNEQVYFVSLLSGFGTITIFKKMGQGFEIIEAKRVKTQKPTEKLVVAEDVELILERALNEAKSPKILTGDDATGEMTLKNKTEGLQTIEGLRIYLKNGNGEDQTVDIATADLMDGGSFKAEVDGEEVSGVVFNNGKDGYRLTFVTGPLARAMLNFVTREQMDKIEETTSDSYPADNYSNEVVETPEMITEVPMNQEPIVQEQAVDQQQYIEALEQAVNERTEATNAENQEPVEILTAEQIQETASNQGFAF